MSILLPVGLFLLAVVLFLNHARHSHYRFLAVIARDWHAYNESMNRRPRHSLNTLCDVVGDTRALREMIARYDEDIARIQDYVDALKSRVPVKHHKKHGMP